MFTPLRVNMKVAGSVLRDNVVGSTTLLTPFQTNQGIISIPLEFLIAHALNGYEAILGATLLLNPELTSAITPTYLCLTDKFKEAVIPMKRACKKIEANFMLCEEIRCIRIPPGVAVRVSARLNTALPDSFETELETTTLVNGLTILNCRLQDQDTVMCTVKNCSKEQLEISQASCLGVAYEQNSDCTFAELNSLRSNLNKQVSEAELKSSDRASDLFEEQKPEESFGEQMIAGELALDRVKAQSILDWEKPDSLYTLQSRLYALNYWTKFIPALAELKFPLQQIVRSQIFCWTEEADQAWERIKAIIALDIRLTIPEQDEQLVLTTDASKIACSCILWVARGSSLRVVGCYSKLFAHTDTLKSIHFKETYALVLAFDHFRAYLLNTDKSVIVFTDARALMWVGRNREYSIACNGLVNKLAKIQLEIPHVVYSVPSEVNYLADVFSRAFSTSRFLEKNQLAMSKPQANNLPPLTEPFLATEEALYQFFALPLHSEESDMYSRKRSKISTPKPVSSLYKLFKDCTPEEKYLSAIRLLQGWDDPQLSGDQALAVIPDNRMTAPKEVTADPMLTDPVKSTAVQI